MEWRQHIYLILKEAINNLVKYSDATKAGIDVGFSRASLEIELEDNGKGFDTSRPVTGNGLLSMRNRADLMQAELDDPVVGRAGMPGDPELENQMNILYDPGQIMLQF